LIAERPLVHGFALLAATLTILRSRLLKP